MADTPASTAGDSSAPDTAPSAHDLALAKLNNTERAYYELDHAMLVAHRTKTLDGDDKANATAYALLRNADLPLLIRVRACMILGCSYEDGFLDWAKEAVRTAEIIMGIVGDKATDAEKKLLSSARKTLVVAEQATKELAEEAEQAGEVGEGEEVEGEDEGEGEVEIEGEVEGEEAAEGKKEGGEQKSVKSKRMRTNPNQITRDAKSPPPVRRSRRNKAAVAVEEQTEDNEDEEGDVKMDD